MASGSCLNFVLPLMIVEIKLLIPLILSTELKSATFSYLAVKSDEVMSLKLSFCNAEFHLFIRFDSVHINSQT